MHIRKNDVVQVISGAEKGKRGKVLRVSLETGRVVVEGVRFIWKHVRPDRQKGIPGGRIQKEMSLSASVVMLYCDGCGKPRRTRAKAKEDGKKARVCVKCGAEMGATA